MLMEEAVIKGTAKDRKIEFHTWDGKEEEEINYDKASL
jgi:hypothetical protein